MDDDAFLARLAEWEAMPGSIHDDTYCASDFPGPLDAKFDALGIIFLEGNEEQRRLLAEMYAAEKPPLRNPNRYLYLDNLGLGYTRRIAQALAAGGDAALLRSGLVAIAIVQEQPDFRDIIISLSFLHLAARKAGLEPAPAFTEIASLARPETRDFMLNFLSRGEKAIDQMVAEFGGLG